MWSQDVEAHGHHMLKWQNVSGLSSFVDHVAGGAGCGQSLTHKARRKLIWRVRGRPLPNLAAELGSVEPAWPTFACTSSSLAYAALT